MYMASGHKLCYPTKYPGEKAYGMSVYMISHVYQLNSLKFT